MQFQSVLKWVSLKSNATEAPTTSWASLILTITCVGELSFGVEQKSNLKMTDYCNFNDTKTHFKTLIAEGSYRKAICPGWRKSILPPEVLGRPEVSCCTGFCASPRSWALLCTSGTRGTSRSTPVELNCQKWFLFARSPFCEMALFVLLDS